MERYGIFFRLAIAATAAAIYHSEAVLAAPPAQAWHDTEIGQPPMAGSSQAGDRSLRIVGSGTGTHQNGDQVHFTSLVHPGGDVEIVARLADFTGPDHARPPRWLFVSGTRRRATTLSSGWSVSRLPMARAKRSTRRAA